MIDYEIYALRYLDGPRFVIKHLLKFECALRIGSKLCWYNANDEQKSLFFADNRTTGVDFYVINLSCKSKVQIRKIESSKLQIATHLGSDSDCVCDNVWYHNASQSIIAHLRKRTSDEQNLITMNIDWLNCKIDSIRVGKIKSHFCGGCKILCYDYATSSMVVDVGWTCGHPIAKLNRKSKRPTRYNIEYSMEVVRCFDFVYDWLHIC